MLRWSEREPGAHGGSRRNRGSHGRPPVSPRAAFCHQRFLRLHGLIVRFQDLFFFFFLSVQVRIYREGAQAKGKGFNGKGKYWYSHSFFFPGWSEVRLAKKKGSKVLFNDGIIVY